MPRPPEPDAEHSTPGSTDGFEASALPVPSTTPDEAAQLGASLLGRRVHAEPLGSQQDANFLLTTDDGPVGVLKVANAGFGATEVDAQDAAAAHLAARLPDLRFATALPGTRTTVAPAADDVRGNIARVLAFLPGGTLHGSAFLHPSVVAELGRLVGRVSVALQDFTHAGAQRSLQWDLRRADRALDAFAGAVPRGDERSLVEQVRRQAWPIVAALDPDLPRQVLHGDITDDNVVCRVQDGLRTPDGVIDFGDTCASWAVAELAVTLSSLLHHEGMTPVGTLAAARAFHDVRPLSVAEADALWPLVALRGAVLVASGHQQVAIDGGANEYAASGLVRESRILAQATSVPLPVMQAAVRAALGLAHPAASLPAAASPLVPQLDGPIARLDLSVTAGDLDDGRWLGSDVEENLALSALDAGAAAVTTAFDEFRLTRAVPLSRTTPATAPTGVDVWFARPVTLVAPWPGEITRTGQGIVITTDDHVLLLTGPGAADHDAAAAADAGLGDALCVVPPRTRLRVTVARRSALDGVGNVPEFVTPDMVSAWRQLICDPGPLLDGPASDVAPPPSPAALLARRRATLAEVQEHYYADPPQLERGWREHLISTTGRSYLDMVNNVAVLGHGHTGFADVVARQLRLLNTNSRFHYDAVVEFSEQLTATLPETLDTVFLLNSGSEAVDLALRIAMAATDRRDVVAVGEAYHGWTYASDAVSTSVADNPNALSTRPDWVHVVDSPNSYRGKYRGEQADRYAAEAVERIDAWAAAGRPPAGFLCEPFYGNAGGIALPDGYLATVYEAVRRHGGLTIADEVQVGYGRLGDWFWGFEQQGVVPDIVTIAKAMGNGHPLGAVVTSRAVAARYRTQGYFFSSAGGSPVSSVIGSYVLRAVRDGGLQANARDVGRHLVGRLEALMTRHELIGAVHGSGLYVGVELVRDRATLEPATAETARLCDRLLDLGVIVQPTGDRLCVLKVKPPLVLRRESADFFVDALDHALTTGF